MRRIPPPPPPAYSQAAVLNSLQNVPNHVHHVFQVAGNVLYKGQPFKSPDQGMSPTPTLRPSMTSLTPSCLYKGAQRPARAECQLTWSSTQPPSLVLRVSAGVLALREVLSTTPTRLLPPYPCMGHHSPPSPSAVKFKRAPFPDPANRNPPWPSKDLLAAADGSAQRRLSSKITAFTHEQAY